MKNYLKPYLFAICLLAWALPALAQTSPPPDSASSSTALAQASKVAVFPFDIFSREPQESLRLNLQDTLIEKLLPEGVQAIPRQEVNKALTESGRPLDLTVARNVASRLGADYAIYGSATIIGNRVSLDVKVLDVLGMRRPQSVYVEGSGLGDLPQMTDRLAREVGSLSAGREQVAEVNVQGNRRIEAEAIKEVMRTKAGGAYSPVRLDEDLRSIWKMGYFDDVRLLTSDTPQGKNVLVEVREKPSIRELRINGMKALDEKDLRDQIELKTFSVYRPEAVKEAEDTIVKLYHDKGYYDVQVSSQVEDLLSGDKGVQITINEGAQVFISTIEFEGNTTFSDKELREQMSTTGRGWFTWLTDSNVLEKSKLEQDVERVTDFYYNAGFLNVRVGEPDIERKEDGMVLTINVVEGPRYSVSDVGVEGDMVVEPQELMGKLKVISGDWFSRDKMREDLANISTLYSDYGYAYVEARPNMRQNNENHTVSVVYNIKQGEKVYFERIIITGNTNTRDKVIRRELSVADGDLFSGSAIRDVNMRLRRLDFFEDVHITTPKGSASDRMDLKIDVKEKRTGHFSIGAGYSTADSFMVMGRVAENNLFGRGQLLEFRGIIGGSANRFIISFTEPWIFDKPVSFGVDIYDWMREYNSYTNETLGGRIRMGWPTPFRNVRFYTYYSYEVTNMTDIENNAAYIIREQEGEHSTSALRAIVRRDTRNHAFNPTSGSDNSISIEYAGGPIGGDNDFTKVVADSGWYIPLWFEHVGVVHGRMGWMNTHSGGDVFTYQKFFLGGINTMRGFEYQSVSPRDPVTNDYLGGMSMLMFNLEYRFPIMPQAGLMGLFFFDVGNVWDGSTDWDLGDLRQSIGAGIRWLSPMGPLRLEYGYVLDPIDGDRRSNWEFTIGSVF